ncbi:MAG TPA: hypothetical protein VMZ28_09350 [Kofleriaceae bacterium]|nr:hypothetical protein [Kofleriaceae bacterium]
MRLFSICRNCAEVHPVETACPACHPLPHLAAAAGRTPPYRRARDEAAPLPALEPARSRGMWRASTVVVSAYVLAVVVLILAVFAQA